MPSKKSNPPAHTQPSPSPPINDHGEHIHPSLKGAAGSSRAERAIHPSHAARPAVVDMALNRNVRVSASGPGWIIATGMGMIRFLSKVSGRNVSMVLVRDGVSGPQMQLPV